PLDKSRGELKALSAIVHRMKSMNYAGGKVKIAHFLNDTADESLRGMILAEMPDARVEIYPAGGLCSYSAEKGGLLIGFEREVE
ncbi:MAG: fatty acid-binding protein DegV, partial [Oscillospiraceae bacterium]|nr:fatty acid-binding protein DegV [Oscillospiraceae bacterium]